MQKELHIFPASWQQYFFIRQNFPFSNNISNKF